MPNALHVHTLAFSANMIGHGGLLACSQRASCAWTKGRIHFGCLGPCRWVTTLIYLKTSSCRYRMTEHVRLTHAQALYTPVPFTVTSCSCLRLPCSVSMKEANEMC